MWQKERIDEPSKKPRPRRGLHDRPKKFMIPSAAVPAGKGIDFDSGMWQSWSSDGNTPCFNGRKNGAVLTARVLTSIHGCGNHNQATEEPLASTTGNDMTRQAALGFETVVK